MTVRRLHENPLPRRGASSGMDDLQKPATRIDLVWTLLAIAAVSLLARLALPLVS